jgi:protein-tyrosine phosphatase
LSQAGHDPSRHRARQFTPDWFDHDLILAMDRSNLADILALDPPDPSRVRLFRDFDPAPDAGPESGAEVPDPWYGGQQGFTDVLAMVERTSARLVAQLLASLR